MCHKLTSSGEIWFHISLPMTRWSCRAASVVVLFLWDAPLQADERYLNCWRVSCLELKCMLRQKCYAKHCVDSQQPPPPRSHQSLKRKDGKRAEVSMLLGVGLMCASECVCPSMHRQEHVQHIPEMRSCDSKILFLGSFFFQCYFCPHPQYMEVPRLGVESELQLLPCATAIATATQDPSHVCDLHHRSRQHWILDPLREAGDRTHILIDPSRVR